MYTNTTSEFSRLERLHGQCSPSNPEGGAHRQSLSLYIDGQSRASSRVGALGTQKGMGGYLDGKYLFASGQGALRSSGHRSTVIVTVTAQVRERCAQLLSNWHQWATRKGTKTILAKYWPSQLRRVWPLSVSIVKVAEKSTRLGA